MAKYFYFYSKLMQKAKKIKNKLRNSNKIWQKLSLKIELKNRNNIWQQLSFKKYMT